MVFKVAQVRCLVKLPTCYVFILTRGHANDRVAQCIHFHMHIMFKLFFFTCIITFQNDLILLIHLTIGHDVGDTFAFF